MFAPSFATLVIAGGSGQRLGLHALGDKARVELAGVTLINRVLAAVVDSEEVVVVGPQQATTGCPLWCRETPAGAGPAAAVAAGLDLVSLPYTLIVAADLPFIGGAVADLLAAIEDPAVDAAVLVRDGRWNYLAAVWRSSSLLAAVARLGATQGRSMRSLYEGAVVREVDDITDAGFDIDSPDDLARAHQRVASSTDPLA